MIKITPCVHSVQMQLDAANKRIAELEKELAKTKQSQESGWLRDSNTHVNKPKEQGE